MTGAERLPFEREQPVALEIAERAVVGEHVETIAGPLERAAGLVAAVRARADVGAEDRGAIVWRQAARDREQLIVGQHGRGVQRRGDDLGLALGIEVGERDLASRLGGRFVDERVRTRLEVAPRREK